MNIVDNMKMYNKERKGKILDPTNAVLIDISESPDPEINVYRLPNEYWTIYNKATTYYDRKWYKKAKDELLKLRGYKKHDTYYTYLLKSYRNIASQYMSRKEYNKATELYGEFFRECEHFITDYDRRMYNKLVDAIEKKNNSIPLRKMELTEKSIPEFLVTECATFIINFIGENKTDKDVYKKKKTWDFIGYLKNCIVFVHTAYQKDSKHYNTNYIIRNLSGVIIKDFAVNYNTLHFACNENSDCFLVSTSESELQTYSRGDFIGDCKVQFDDAQNYHITSISIAPNNNYFLYTYADKVCILDMGFQKISTWKTPLKEGWKKRTDAAPNDPMIEHRKYLDVLHLHGVPTEEEIKKAFRKMIMVYHPDYNPDDPQAEMKSREIIQAYEILTKEDAHLAFLGHENAEYYYKVIDEIKIDIPNTPFTITMEWSEIGPGEDWIYSSHISLDGDSIYLCCYSGKIYCVTKEGTVKKKYDVHTVIDSIFEKNEYLYIRTYHHLIIMKYDKVVGQIKIKQHRRLMWYNNGFVFIEKNKIEIYSLGGDEIGIIQMKSPVYDVFFVNCNIHIVTSLKTFLFNIETTIQG